MRRPRALADDCARGFADGVRGEVSRGFAGAACVMDGIQYIEIMGVRVGAHAYARAGL